MLAPPPCPTWEVDCVTEVIVRSGNIEGALRTLGKNIAKEGTLRLARRRSRFESKRDERIRKAKAARRRASRESRKLSD